MQALVLTTAGEAATGQVVRMSRTDVHRPWLVQIEDPTNRHLVISYGRNQENRYLLMHTCGCEMCTGRVYRKRQNRRNRIQWRKVSRELLKAQKDDLDAVEPLPARYITW